MDEVSFITVKRWIFRIVLFVFLGAVVNVAVAWGFAIGLPLYTLSGPTERNSSTGDQVPYWIVEQLQRTGAMRYVWLYMVYDFDDAPGTYLDIFPKIEPVDLYNRPNWSQVDYSNPAQEYHEHWVYFIEDARGWPLLSMSSFTAMGVDPLGEKLLFETSGGFSVPDSLRSQPLYEDIEEEWFNRPIIPLSPIWPGFAINTIIYAVIVWILWSSMFATRNFMRNKRGLCIKCGYDLRGTEHEVCPECGAA